MQTVLITGGSRGIGAAAVRRFAAGGWRVAFLYHRSAEAAALLAKQTGAIPLACNVADSGQVDAACQQALCQLGHMDALVCSAGLAQQKLFTDITDEDWQQMLHVNLSGAFYAARALLPAMVSRKSGKIVFVSSMWGQVGASMEVHYSTAKAGLIGMTRALAKEVAPSGIRVNCVAPGVIETDMTAGLGPDTLGGLRQEVPLGRLGAPEDVAQSIYWLCGQESAYVTGQVLAVNGGMVIG